MNERIGFIITAACLLIFLSFGIRRNLFRDMREMQRVAKIAAHNVDYQISPDRSRPVAYMEREMTLQVFYPDFFNRFNQNDWRKFWDIIYGTKPLIDFRNQNLPEAQRNFYIQEAQHELSLQYPGFFTNFNQQQWEEFWQVIFAIKRVPVAEMDDMTQGSTRIPKSTRMKHRLDSKIKEDTKRIDETVSGVREGVGY